MSGAAAFAGNERFRIDGTLGTGGMGVVYAAWDRQRGMRVALKTMSEVDPTRLYLLKKEFRVLADVAHPNLITLYELMSTDDQWYFTMELVDGEHFLSWVRPPRPGQFADSLPSTQSIPGGPLGLPVTLDAWHAAAARSDLPSLPAPLAAAFDEGRMRGALSQLAQGLMALHAAGTLHRDIKPSNVLVTPEARVVLLDFGLATATLQPPSAGRIAGTPEYMSPEQMAGLALGEASDWYSVGVMVYEALTGRSPFGDRNSGWDKLVAARRSTRPFLPSVLVQGVPPDLDALVADLLRPDPPGRPTGADILRRLGAASAATSVDFGNDGPGERHPSILVGRERHMAALRAALAETRAGRKVGVTVRGPSGFGKSALLHAFGDELVARNEALVLEGRCYERESVPYKGVDSLVDALALHLGELPAADAAALLPSGIGSLAAMFPILGAVPAVQMAAALESLVPDAQEQRRRAFAALRDLMRRMATHRTLVLFIDDLQWSDPDSAALLDEVLREPGAPPLLLVTVWRDGTGEDGTTLPDFAGRDTREIVVAALTTAEAAKLASALLDERSGLDARGELIARESGGNPFFVHELVRHARRQQSDLVPGAVRLTLEDLLGTRLAALPDDARGLIETVAVAGRPTALGVARRAAGLDAAETTALAALRGGHLARVTGAHGGEEVECYHDRVRETVIGSLPAGRLAARHLALAIAIEQSHPDDAETLAAHFAAAGERERAAPYALRAAEAAARTLAFDRAALLYRAALELAAPTGEDRRRCRLGLGDALAHAGRGEPAAEAYLAAAAEAIDGEQAGELRRRAAEQLLLCGRIDQGLAELRRVLASVGMRLPATPRRALVSLAWRRVLVRLRGLTVREHPESQLAPPLRAKLDVCWAVTTGLGMVDTIRAADYEARHFLLAMKAGERNRVARALASEAAFHSIGGGPVRARTDRLVAAALDYARRLGDPEALALAWTAAAIAAFHVGEFRRALEAADEAERIYRESCAGVAWKVGLARHYSRMSLTWLGELGELCRRVPQTLREAAEQGNLYERVMASTGVANTCFLVPDTPDEARRNVVEAMAGWSNQGFHLEHHYELLAQTQIDLYTGDAARAFARVEEAFPALQASLLLHVQMARVDAWSMRARTALALAREGGGSVGIGPLLVRAERAISVLAKQRVPWTRALATLLGAGLCAVRAGGGHAAGATPDAASGDAATLLDAAIADFEYQGMLLCASCARWQRGRLEAGEPGRARMDEAERWMAERGVKNPARMAAMMAPGFAA